MYTTNVIPGFELLDFIKLVGVLGVALVIFAESGLLIGFFLPGDSLLFATGFLTYSGFIPLNVHLVVLIMFLAAVLGDSVGYAFGRKVGPRIFKRPNARLFKQEYLRKAQQFYDVHGGKTIIIARFIPIVRTFAPIVAGTARMKYRRFLAFNLIGGALWVTVTIYSGYFLGRWLEARGIEIDHVLLPIILVIIILSILPPLVHILRNKEQRTALWNGTKRELASLIKRK
jgi:membrane-associated protein